MDLRIALSVGRYRTAADAVAINRKVDVVKAVFLATSTLLTAQSPAMLTLLNLVLAVRQDVSYPAHYLVGLLHLPNSYVPPELRNHTSGTVKAEGQTCAETDYSDPWCDMEKGPWPYVPGVGFSDIEFALTGAVDEFICTTDNGFGSAGNSWDYPLHLHKMKLRKPFTFRFGESTFEPYTQAESLGVTLLRDPNNLIRWENGADIQVEYATPDSTWDDWKAARVLTGRDFDLEGLAMKNSTYAVAGEELMVALFPIDPSTGIVLGNFVRTPDIDLNGEFNGKFLSSVADKVHCPEAGLIDNTCFAGEDFTEKTMEFADGTSKTFIRHGTSGGYEGLSYMADGSVAAFVERTSGSVIADRGEPGDSRVYRVNPDPLQFESFYGWYKFEPGAGAIADTSPLPGSATKIAVIERGNWPNGKYIAGQGTPNNRVCIIDLLETDENKVFKKNCILNYQAVQDPFDTDGDGLTTYAFSQWTSEQLLILDNHCMIAGTDTNFPGTNQFSLTSDDAPFFSQTLDSRWMFVCFYDAVFATPESKSKYTVNAPSTPVEIMPKHYLVGVNNYNSSFVPAELQAASPTGHTSGVGITGPTCEELLQSGVEVGAWQCPVATPPSPEAGWDFVPGVGFSDIEFYYDENNQKVTGEYLLTSDNAFGKHYPLYLQRMEIKKPFAYRHGGATFEKYTPTKSNGVLLLSDPNEHIDWGNGAKLQVEYSTPDSTWDDWKAARVLTGRDFDLEGLAVVNHTYAVCGEEFVTALFPIDPSTGIVLGNFVRTPDVDLNGEFNGKFLSTTHDKSHCALADLEADSCDSVPAELVEANGYTRHGRGGGYEGLTYMGDNTIAAFLQHNSGSALEDRNEPGYRVYRATAAPLEFTGFYGWYKLEEGAHAIGDVFALPGSTTKVAVHERPDSPGFPDGKFFPGQNSPTFRVCIIDLEETNEDKSFKKTCVLHQLAVSDPFDADNNGLVGPSAPMIQWSTEQLLVIDEWCMMLGADTDYPSSNMFGLTRSEVDFVIEDTRWATVCFYEPVFSPTYDVAMSLHTSASPPATPPALPAACGAGHSCDEGYECYCKPTPSGERDLLFASHPRPNNPCYCFPSV